MTEPATPATVDDVDRLLLDFLDMYRSVAVRKLEGLTTEQATAVATPTGMTLLSIVQHLAWDERIWFDYHFLARPVAPMESDPSFRLEPSATVESVVAAYQADCQRSLQIIADAPSFDTVVRVPHGHFGAVDLRWIIVHMIEEVARHVGHMDILREQTDGSTGW
jgi:hypothetical protein